MTADMVAPSAAPPLSDAGDYRGVRWLTAGAAALGALWVPANLVWPTTWLAEGVRLGLSLVLMLTVFGVTVAGLLVQGRRYRRPAGLRTRATGVFTVPANPLAGYAAAVLTLFGGDLWGQQVHAQRTPANLDLGRFGQLVDWSSRLSLFAVTAVAALLVGVLVIGRRTRIDLTATAVLMRGPFGTRVIGWDSLRPDGPVQVTAPPLPRLTFSLTDPASLVTTGLARRTTVQGWAHRSITAAYFAAVVTWYVDHPEQRSGIGTAAGYHALVTALGTPEAV